MQMIENDCSNNKIAVFSVACFVPSLLMSDGTLGRMH